MTGSMGIDTAFDFRSDAAGGDPDKYSPTLRQYHRTLWSKPLPSGEPFDLDDTAPGGYLRHRSHLGEFFLTSDTALPTYKSAMAAHPNSAANTDACSACRPAATRSKCARLRPCRDNRRDVTPDGAHARS
jgi:hypothetical protein